MMPAPIAIQLTSNSFRIQSPEAGSIKGSLNTMVSSSAMFDACSTEAGATPVEEKYLFGSFLLDSLSVS